MIFAKEGIFNGRNARYACSLDADVLPSVLQSCLSTTSDSCVAAINILAISSEYVSKLGSAGATYLDSVAKSESKAMK